MSEKANFINLREHHEKTVERIRGLFPQIYATKEAQEKEKTMNEMTVDWGIPLKEEIINPIISFPAVIELTESSLKDEIKKELQEEFESRLNEIKEFLITKIDEYLTGKFENYNITPKL